MHESMFGQARQFRKLTNCKEPFGSFRMKNSQGQWGCLIGEQMLLYSSVICPGISTDYRSQSSQSDEHQKPGRSEQKGYGQAGKNQQKAHVFGSGTPTYPSTNKKVKCQEVDPPRHDRVWI
jgi:hypothetical protein